MSDKLLIAFAGRMKHGELLRAIQRRGWSQKQAAEFLGMNQSDFGRMINLKWVPSRFSTKLERKLHELTGKSVEDLFPPELRDKKFLATEKAVTAFREVDAKVLADIGILQLPPTPDEEQERRELVKLLEDSMEMLKPVEIEIIRRRFGYYGHEETLREIGNRLGVVPEYVRQIEARAIRKLRHPRCSWKIRNFLPTTYET